jgi:hypothetical protein
MTRPRGAWQDWNVVVTVYEEGFKPAKRALSQAGAISPTDYHDVLVMKVEDPHAFTTWLAALVSQEPGLLNFISRAVPAAQIFAFHSARSSKPKRARRC